MEDTIKAVCLECEKTVTLKLLLAGEGNDHPEDVMVCCPNCDNWESGQLPLQGFKVIDEI